MRELMGKIPTKDPNITEVVYLSEIVRCLGCQRRCRWVLRSGHSQKKWGIQEGSRARVLLPHTRS